MNLPHSSMYFISGKSFVYNVSTFRRLLEQKDSTALYIFPTKALAQDQLRVIHQWIGGAGLLDKIHVAIVDGDTSKIDRIEAREHARLLLVNPDILHASILPNHSSWKRFLLRLNLVVIDELHVYHGTFGSHVSLVMRRLRRVCLHYGNSNVQFIACSATTGMYAYWS